MIGDMYMCLRPIFFLWRFYFLIEIGLYDMDTPIASHKNPGEQ